MPAAENARSSSEPPVAGRCSQSPIKSPQSSTLTASLAAPRVHAHSFTQKHEGAHSGILQSEGAARREGGIQGGAGKERGTSRGCVEVG
ncbi:hypothetical protein FA09DRAFT_62370 [Tilletiopsis washingtonensis]|uniref:Uncharacterized protein n=1 Tax=Tilletiopsis washingtonensis TaxID=58919 RepID=A0A316Z5T9_9BASI|nr:hypothetical protein FA09DRAFT_62370 [Tilletiopsis washingtonensis]PWN97150.1 hypothetical protein FA09DRAFT_62370 [Tilletiopsis washingtonensis]